MMIDIFIQGKCEPGGSKTGYYIKAMNRVNIVDANKKAAPWKKFIAEEVKGNLPEDFEMFEEPVIMMATFFLARPKGHMRKDGGLSADGRRKPYPAVKPDALKLLRPVEDALSGIIYRDDALIIESYMSKVYVNDAEDAGVNVIVMKHAEFELDIGIEKRKI